jgi:hypothetical protein
MAAKPTTVTEYLASLPEDRRRAIQAVRAAVNKGLPKGYREGIQYGMIGWYVPHSIFPAGYHCDPKQPVPFASLASQKNHMALYLTCIYGNEKHKKWFEGAWKQTGRKLDMGKSCVRFKRADDVALDVVTEAVSRVPVESFLKAYEEAISPAAKAARKKARKKAGKKAGEKKAAKKTGKKKAAKKKVAKKTTRKKS